MTAVITPIDSKLQIKTTVGTLASGADKVKSVSLKGIDASADGQLLLDVSNAIGGVITAPVVKIVRVDEKLVSAE